MKNDRETLTGGMTQLLQRVADALRDDLTNMADAIRVGEDFRSAVRVEQAVESVLSGSGRQPAS
jgi:hypothetical protein